MEMRCIARLEHWIAAVAGALHSKSLVAAHYSPSNINTQPVSWDSHGGVAMAGRDGRRAAI